MKGCFNEAGARMLRKWGTVTCMRSRPTPGFNEAGARMLRKWPLVARFIACREDASMRPEHGCSGNGAFKLLRSGDFFASMRPEHGCSGNDNDGAYLLRIRRHASMRPEHGCSGNVNRLQHCRPYRQASMRPEHGCSGNDQNQWKTKRSISCFNEAGARMLRKWCWLPVRRDGGEDCFNEAGARMLRK